MCINAAKGTSGEGVMSVTIYQSLSLVFQILNLVENEICPEQVTFIYSALFCDLKDINAAKYLAVSRQAKI